MDFKPFDPPPSDHHQFNTGLSSELGTTPKQLIEGMNAYLKHVFEVLKGETNHVIEHADDTARDRIEDLAEHVTALEMKLEQLLSAFKAVVKQPQETAAPVQSSGDPLQDAITAAAG